MSAWSLAHVRALVIDVDGVLWHGKQNLPGVPAFFDFLRARDIAFIIATNNSARPASEIVERLARMNVAVNDAQVLTSAEATARYLPRLVSKGARVLLVGGQGIADELTRAGFQLVERDADAVVVGIDWQLTYDKLKRATVEIRRGAKFIGTNGDKTFPTEEGLVPGAGSLIAAIQTATDVAPTIIGKPERAMYDIALEKIGAARATAAMLGDRLDTDIQGAQRAGLAGILVLTGVVKREHLAGASIVPELVVENLDALRAAWTGAQ